MTPYYEDDLITLYHGDCLEHPDLWTNADVLVTDPPYGMNFQSGMRKTGRLDKIAGDMDTTSRDNALNLWGGIGPLSCSAGTASPPQPERDSDSSGGRKATPAWVI